MTILNLRNMSNVLFFMGGCIFSLLLALGCLYLTYNVLQFKENTEIRREIKKNKLHSPVPQGKVIRPKTQEEYDQERDEEFQAFNKILEE